jgi:hypothetical protein
MQAGIGRPPSNPEITMSMPRCNIGGERNGQLAQRQSRRASQPGGHPEFKPSQSQRASQPGGHPGYTHQADSPFILQSPCVCKSISHTTSVGIRMVSQQLDNSSELPGFAGTLDKLQWYTVLHWVWPLPVPSGDSDTVSPFASSGPVNLWQPRNLQRQ